MTQDDAKTTAVAAALLRAAHAQFDDDPKIFVDEFALALSGVGDEADLRAAVDDLQARVAHLPGHAVFRGGAVLSRQRYTEEALDDAMGRGCDQFLILGAGLDSFAFRRPDLVDAVQVFEVDFPATQRMKQERLAELGIETPANLTFVPVDFENDDLVTCLTEGGMSLERPVFVSWLGTTMFLTDEANFGTFALVAKLPASSEIVFDYFVPPSELDDAGCAQFGHLQQFAAGRGEPFQSLFVPAELRQRLLGLGYRSVVDTDPDEISHRYFGERSDGLVVAPHMHLISATV